VTAEAQHQCPHCRAAYDRFSEFCTSCGRRLTSVKPEGRFTRIGRVLRILKPADALGANPKGVGEAYKHGPMNHPR
jgi:hypothetical protein